MAHRPENHSHNPEDARIAELAGAYADALIAGDEIAAEIAIREAMDAELPTAAIDEKVIAPALWLIGELWEQGQISIAEEHIATEITVRVLALQHEARRVARERAAHRVMLATPPGELHVVALRMVENLVRGAGYDVVMLGPDVPASTLAGAARHHRADVLCLSSTMPGHRDDLLAIIDEVRLEWPGAAFVLGGRGLTVEDQMRPQVQFCHGVADAGDAVDALIQRAGLN
ncbi:MAG TPA: cobalamin-dependent protein [Solirubrobacteraceae bacterium]|nr:cobalamin-dependent protein [Solirubrobacteraceae bacterium]